MSNELKEASIWFFSCPACTLMLSLIFFHRSAGGGNNVHGKDEIRLPMDYNSVNRAKLLQTEAFANVLWGMKYILDFVNKH